MYISGQNFGFRVIALSASGDFEVASINLDYRREFTLEYLKSKNAWPSPGVSFIVVLISARWNLRLILCRLPLCSTVKVTS